MIACWRKIQGINGPVAAGRQRASGLRFADPRVHALLHAVILFRQLAQGFRSNDLRQQLAALSGRDPESVSQGAVTVSSKVHQIPGAIAQRAQSRPHGPVGAMGSKAT